MKLTINKDILLKPLLAVQGVVERRQTLPILSNILMVLQNETLSVTATDMEVELVSHISVTKGTNGEITVPARKMIDICRSLPDGAEIHFDGGGDRATVKSGRSKFTLTTLPAEDYPSSDSLSESIRVTLSQESIKTLIDLTQFAMANQDVRYFLNGLLLEIGSEGISAIATDGHRLAIANHPCETGHSGDVQQIIVPRKAVTELSRLLSNEDGEITVEIGSNALRISLNSIQMTTKLIDGRFPDYQKVIPEITEGVREIRVVRELLRQSLARASILSNEKYKAVRLVLDDGVLRIVANNPDQEEAQDEIEVDYAGGALEIGFNVSYLMDALSVLPTETALVYLTDSSSSCLIRGDGRDDCQYVVMPMRL